MILGLVDIIKLLNMLRDKENGYWGKCAEVKTHVRYLFIKLTYLRVKLEYVWYWIYNLMATLV